MASKPPLPVQVFIVPLVQRPEVEVLPNVPGLVNTQNGPNPPPPQAPPAPGQDGGRNPRGGDGPPKPVMVTTWNVHPNNDDMQRYFNWTCRSMCTAESIDRVIRHLSLWEHVGDPQYANGTRPETRDGDEPPNDDFIVVLEDHNTVLDTDVFEPLVEAMGSKGIDIMELTSSVTATTSYTMLSENPPLVSYQSGVVFNASAYIIRVSAAHRLAKEIVDSGGLHTGIGFEMARLERDMGLVRHTLSDARSYVYSDVRLKAVRRAQVTRPCLWNRALTWLSKRFPDMAYALSTPLVSVFGLFEINVVGVVIIALLLLMIVFDVSYRLPWFLMGILVTAVV
ncbi:IMV heparin binding surface protein [Squirrelpox virus]|uniref:IMV heparin binding surface protein n=1 Tax=Squirrelpox virus TaxID=240426 RepID=U3UBJ8_9POXV|nr:IMV heparin binding surface protein [Squirrelpox virus]CCD83250.1 IMV heparin binding surface protein [Squirrelpox virus]